MRQGRFSLPAVSSINAKSRSRRREIALDGGLAGTELLSELLHPIGFGHIGKQAEQRPLAHELYRVRAPLA